jgi:CheY-like chemotaxis protein
MTDLLTDRRILVVEDEMLVLMNIEMALEDLGCSAIGATATVADALQALSTHQFDAALVDVNLGGEKSYPVADALAQRGIPFAFCTGCGDHGERHDLDCRLVLRKPYLRSDLIAVLKQLLPDQTARER